MWRCSISQLMGRSMINEHWTWLKALLKGCNSISQGPLCYQKITCAHLDGRFVYATPTSDIFYITGSQTGFENLANTPNVSEILRKFNRKYLILIRPTYFRIWEVRGSDIDPEADYPHRDYSWLSSVNPGKFRTELKSKTLLLSSKCFLIQNSSTTLLL